MTVGFWEGLQRTRVFLQDGMRSIFSSSKGEGEYDPEKLEEILLRADFGAATTRRLLETVRGKKNHPESLREEIIRILSGPAVQSGPAVTAPRVIFVVGVNGVGKTTTIAKLAYRERQQGRSVLLAAADTFRAAAIEQLTVWAERIDVPIVSHRAGGDPAAVLFDSLKAARARGIDVVISDTAGRIHTRGDLMDELKKLRRVAGREIPGAPHEVLLVLDATLGQNSLVQARTFLEVAGVTGVVLAKLDGTAKGGIAVAVAGELEIPIRYAGIGESLEDLEEFSPEEFARAVLPD